MSLGSSIRRVRDGPGCLTHLQRSDCAIILAEDGQMLSECLRLIWIQCVQSEAFGLFLHRFIAVTFTNLPDQCGSKGSHSCCLHGRIKGLEVNISCKIDSDRPDKSVPKRRVGKVEFFLIPAQEITFLKDTTVKNVREIP